jgi:hypothetical protein
MSDDPEITDEQLSEAADKFRDILREILRDAPLDFYIIEYEDDNE